MAARRTKNHELGAADRGALPDELFAFPRVRKEQARDRDIPGRSTMTKAELLRALSKR